MKKSILLILLSFNFFTFSQNSQQTELPFIEVTGTPAPTRIPARAN